MSLIFKHLVIFLTQISSLLLLVTLLLFLTHFSMHKGLLDRWLIRREVAGHYFSSILLSYNVNCIFR